MECGMEWNVEWNGMEWNGMEWNVEWNGMEWNGMEWNGMEWNGMECGMECGMEWNGVWKSNDVDFVALKIRPSTVIVTMPAATSCPLERKHF